MFKLRLPIALAPSRMPLARAAAVACWLAMATLPATALADDARDLLWRYSVTTAGFYEGGATDFSAVAAGGTLKASGMGVRYYERNGLITGTIVAVAQVLAKSAQAAGPKSIERWEDSTYRYEKRTYYSEEEKAVIRDRGARAAGEAFGSKTQCFDLRLYSRNLGGAASGFHATLFPFSVLDSENSRLDLGIMFGRIDAVVSDGGSPFAIRANAFGIPLRYNYAIGHALVHAQFDINFLGNMPLHVGASAALFNRLFVDAAVTTPKVTSGQFGLSTSVGARF